MTQTNQSDTDREEDIAGVTSSSSDKLAYSLKDEQLSLQVEVESDGITDDARWYKFSNCRRAQAYNICGLGRGALVMSNIFLSTSLIFLASKEAGCLTEDGDEVLDSCDEKVKGSSPTALIANIAVVSGVLSALFMPVAGACIDYTHHRRNTGIMSALLMILIQITQIGTISKTWFAMAILQAIAGFLYQVQVLATYAYLPEMSRQVGEERMTKHTAIFVICQFGSQASFLIVVVALSLAAGWDDVMTAHVSQAINAVWAGLAFYIGWKMMPTVPASHELPADKSLWTQGFAQIYHTAQRINREYATGLRWYLLAVVFAEAGVNSFTTLSVIYLDEHIGMSGTEIGIFFLVVLFASLPGSIVGARITQYLNPNSSWQLCMGFLIVTTAGGAVIVDASPKAVSYAWGVCIGLLLGWFYPTENLFFSMILPKGQEAELSGFFVYCTQILGWLPPLIFSILVNADVSQTYGVMSLTAFIFLAIVMTSRAAPWAEIMTATVGVSSASAAAAVAAHGRINGGKDEEKV